MNKVRDLLLDCRIELRSLVRDFQKTELCRRIDDLRAELAQGRPSASEAEPSSVAGTDQVAQAWRMAAEDLKVTAPAIYELLTKKAARLLAAASVQNASTALAPADADTPVEVSAVMAMPAAAAENTAAAAATPIDPPEPEAVVVTTTPEPPAAPTEPLSHSPTREVLELIARSKRRFTEVQREWCVGEALVRSSFTVHPNEFIALGDHGMARYILDSEPTADE